jgi:hypothetical protein
MMKLTFKENIVFRKTTNDLIMLFDKSNGLMYEFNDTASYIINQISQNIEIETIKENILTEYEVEEEQIDSEISALLKQLNDAGLIKIEE